MTLLKVRSLRQFEVFQLVELQEQSHPSAICDSVLGIWYSVVYYIKAPIVTNTLFPPPLLISQQKHCVCGKFPVVAIKTPACFSS
jgi:hypothetical protein